MNILVDLGINLFAAFIGFGVGWLWQRIRQGIRLRKACRFWKPFFTSDLRVIVGRHREFASFEPSGFLGVGSAIGLSELSAHFESLGLRNFVVSYADRIDGDALKSNLILIGGPDGNNITKEAVSRIESTIRFGDPQHHEIAIYDVSDNKVYAPKLDPDLNEVNLDYGVILKTTNPFAPHKYILIIAGSFGYGTWAAIRFILSKTFIESPIVVKEQSVECLIESDVIRDTPQDIRSVVFRPLGKNKVDTKQ